MAAMMMTSRLRTGLISFIRPGLIGLPAMAPCSTMPPGTSDAAAGVTAELEEKIVAQLGESTAAVVRDTSGGCGTMYNIEVESPSFNGLSTVKQHKLVADILKDDIKKWHGFTMKTRKPR